MSYMHCSFFKSLTYSRCFSKHSYFVGIETFFFEWFGYLHNDGSIISTLKGNLWKGFFHIPRMKLISWQLLENFSNEQVL